MLSFILPYLVALIFYFGLWKLILMCFAWIDKKCDEDFKERVDRYRR